MNATPWKMTARWVFPVDRPPLPHGVVTIAGQRIVAVEATGQANLDLGDAAILPGFVNAHTHLDLTGARGQCPPTPDFTGWLRQVIAFRRARTVQQMQSDIGVGIKEAIASGTTLVGDISAGGLSLPLLAERQIRATVFFELLGLTPERAAASDAQARAWLDRSTSSALRLGLSPHAPYSVSRDLFQAATGLAQEKSRALAVHLAETRAELELLAERGGPFVNFLQEMGVFDPDGLTTSLAEILSLLPTSTPVLLVHGNYLDRELVVSSNQSIIYCPRTHAAFGHPPHPFRKFMARGVRVALGTDSLASNPDLDILAEARFVRRQHRDMPGADLLRMLTQAGAEALGWADETGSLTPGKSADLAVLPVPARTVADPHELVFDSDLAVAKVMVAGQWVT